MKRSTSLRQYRNTDDAEAMTDAGDFGWLASLAYQDKFQRATSRYHRLDHIAFVILRQEAA